jgi:hypothetical protein
MGYAARVDESKPWLTGDKTVQGVQSIITQAAVEMFELMFDGVDLSGELAALRVSGEGSKKASSEGSRGFIPTKSQPKSSKKKGKR